MGTLARLIGVTALLAAQSVAIAQQGPTPAPPSQPTFRAGTTLAQVEAVVTDSAGAVVRGLTQEDFSLEEDGQPRPIAAFSFVDVPLEPVTSSDASTVEPDVSSNGAREGRVYLIVLDDLLTASLRGVLVRDAARLFIQQYLRDNDMAAVFYTSGRPDAWQDFTNNRRLLLAAVDQFAGSQAPSLLRVPTVAESPGGADARTTRQMEVQSQVIRMQASLRDLAEAAGTALPGHRKSMLLFSEGIRGYGEGDLVDSCNRAGRAVGFGALCEVAAAAARASVAIFTIDPRGLSAQLSEIDDGRTTERAELGADRASASGQLSLRVLGDDTGGLSIVNTNRIADGFERIVRDSSSYYVLAFQPPSSQPGIFRRLTVRLGKPGMEVRARRGYAVANPNSVRRASTGTPGLTDDLQRALDSPLPVSDLRLTMVATPFRSGGRNTSILVAGEVQGVEFMQDGRAGRMQGALELVYGAVGARKVEAGGRATVRVGIAPAQLDTATEQGVRFFRRFDLPPGKYQLRLAVRDTNSGKVGSVLRDLEVPDLTNARSDLAMSGLVIASAAAGGVTANQGERLVDLIGRNPVARRVFAADEGLAVFAEIYRGAAGELGTTVTTSVVTADGTVAFEQERMLGGADFSGSRRAHAHLVEIPVGALQPGNYVLRVGARSSATPNATVSRAVPFRIVLPRSDAPASPEGADRTLELAGSYVRDFITRTASVVAEETYLQRITTLGRAVPRTRELTSDFRLVRTSEADDWAAFRDVFEVDGKSLGDRDRRLKELFLMPPQALADRVSAIAIESARHSLPDWGVLNNPLIALSFLQDRYRRRFRFSREDGPALPGVPETVVFRYAEQARPTLLNNDGLDVVARGRVWLEPGTGRVAQTELTVRGSTITTRFDFNADLDLRVPGQLREQYFLGAGAQAVGLATYANFRRFGISTTETLR